MCWPPIHGQLWVCNCRTVGLEVVDVLGEVGNRFALNLSPETQNHSAANGSCGTAFLHRLDHCNSLLTDLLLSVSLISNSLSILLREGSLHPLPLKSFTFFSLSWGEIPFWEGHTRLFRIWPLQVSSVWLTSVPSGSSSVTSSYLDTHSQPLQLPKTLYQYSPILYEVCLWLRYHNFLPSESSLVFSSLPRIHLAPSTWLLLSGITSPQHTYT